jgi:hypothetical protein
MLICKTYNKNGKYIIQICKTYKENGKPFMRSNEQTKMKYHHRMKN